MLIVMSGAAGGVALDGLADHFGRGKLVRS
jgi:hypothetical protein